MANLHPFAMVNHINSEPGNPSNESPSTGSGISLQLVGKPFAEEIVLRVAHAYEARHEWKDRLPAL